jgi:hypothetical protein
MMTFNSAGCGARGTSLWALSLVAALLLAGCASDKPPEPQGGPPPGGPGGGRFGSGPGGPGGPEEGGRFRPSLFISPSGEPFHGQPGQPYPVTAWFTGADANGDGKLTREEFIADAARFFARLDANHDGVIDGFEVKAYETDIAPEIVADQGPLDAPRAQSSGGGQGAAGGSGQGGGGRGGGGRRGGGGGRGGGQGGASGSGARSPIAGGAGINAQGAAPYGLLPDREPVASADLDLTTKITLKNFETRASQRFDRLDTKGQGYLILAELPKTPLQKVLERRQERRQQNGQRPPPPQG